VPTDTDAAIDSFRAKLATLPKGMILSVEGTPVHGVARVQVSNIWLEAKPYQQRQMTEMLAGAWRYEMKGESAILHVYDITGREIAGTRAFGGVWIEDE
jgi:hypothetical protein